MKNVLFHGELILKEVASVPSKAKKLNVKESFKVLADSETTGNDHRVAVKEGVEIYELNGVLYLENDVATEVYCPNEKRHGRRELKPGHWQIGIAQEFDPFEARKRNVAD